jgi:hypothetical protein
MGASFAVQQYFKLTGAHYCDVTLDLITLAEASTVAMQRNKAMVCTGHQIRLVGSLCFALEQEHERSEAGLLSALQDVRQRRQ